jgi:glycerophosphoryl diester phosphodiesterase
MKDLLQWGVNGIITNFPDLLSSVAAGFHDEF